MRYRIYVKDGRTVGNYLNQQNVMKKHVKRVQGIVDWIYEVFKTGKLHTYFPIIPTLHQEHQQLSTLLPSPTITPIYSKTPSNSIPPSSEPLFDRLLN
jgi:hypothetical protein